MDSLERLARTGEPRHVTHDEGQELDETVKEALAAGGDVDLQWLATARRCPRTGYSAPVVVSHPHRRTQRSR